MNPILGAALGSLFRWALAYGAGWLVTHGIWTQGDATIYVAAGAMAAVSLIWSLWEKYSSRIHLLTALSMTPLSEMMLEGLVKSGADTPSAFAPKTISLPPRVVKT